LRIERQEELSLRHIFRGRFRAKAKIAVYAARRIMPVGDALDNGRRAGGDVAAGKDPGREVI
jgi:hypothetical protein